MIIFYHSTDIDGHCSGAIARKCVKDVYPNDEIVMYGINYGDDFPWDKVENERVIMLDFSLQPFEDMIKLHEITKEFVWIDHHISAINEYNKQDTILMGKRQIDKAACGLAWEYFFGKKPIPKAVYLLGRYDVWDLSGPETLPFQYGMRLYDTDPSNGNFNWDEVFHSFPYNILGEGETALKYIEQDNKKYAEFSSFETSIDGLKCIAINKMMANSGMFNSVWDEAKYDVMIAFGWKKDKWTVSLYTTKTNIDVSEIAKKFGGGGHKKAAGFQCEKDKLPFI